MAKEPQDQEQIDAELHRMASAMPALRFDPDRGRELAESNRQGLSLVGGAREATRETPIVASWRRVAGDEPLEARHSWVDVPPEILDAVRHTVDSRLSVEPEGSLGDFRGAIVTLDVFGEVPGRLVLVDSTGTECAMSLDNGSLVAVIPAASMAYRSEEEGLPVYEGLVRLRWHEE